MNDIKLARFLGLFSLGLGAVEIVKGRAIADELGVEKPELVQVFGGREVLAGLLTLAYPDRAWPIWGRVAGDVADLALLASALGRGNQSRHNAAWAAIAVLGVTLLDAGVAVSLSRRDQRALATARRTRVKRISAS